MNAQLSSLVAAMEILPDGLLIVDQAQRIVGCNRIAETLFGYDAGELIDQSLSVLLPPDAHDAHARHVASYSPRTGGRPMEERPILFGVSKSGAKIPLSIGISVTGHGEDRHYVAVLRDARSLDDTLESAMSLAETDPLTQLGNRRYLSGKLAECAAENQNAPLALLFLDLDRFKPLNDRYGHEFGDLVLGIVARRLRACLRDEDTCIRLGGDEFVVLVAGVHDPATLRKVAMKLHAKVTAPMRVNKVTERVGVSIGGVIGTQDRAGPERLLEQADAAMYDAKTHGLPYCYQEIRRADAA
jgi:diguanylate cyclase (GGDEF)-like protein/PAS domain S-box-containing protein